MREIAKLRSVLTDTEMRHPRFNELHLQMRERIEAAIAGFEVPVECIVGPTRVGKSRLVDALAREFPSQRVEGRLSVPVLRVALDSGVSTTELPGSVLGALGVRPPKVRAGALTRLMRDQLQLAGTKVLLLDEASHLVEKGVKVTSQEVTDWLKTLVEKQNIALLMFGVPRLVTLLDSNEQLKHRSLRPIEFRPYDFRFPEEQKAFIACVRTYADMFREAGVPIEVPIQVLVPNCYLLSAGAIGILRRFMQELAVRAGRKGLQTVTFADCAAVAASFHLAGPAQHAPFKKEEVALIELSAVHSHFLDKDGMAALPAEPYVGRASA